MNRQIEGGGFKVFFCQRSQGTVGFVFEDKTGFLFAAGQ
jgi:hypothetical protein